MTTSRLDRSVSWLLVGALAAITAVVSYLHALWVVQSVGNSGPVAYLVPFVPDLMIVTSSKTLLHAARTGAQRPWQAVLSLGIGVVVTVIMNVTAGLHHGRGGALVAGLIPVAFILTFETLLVLVRQAQEAPLTDEPAAGCGHKVATTKQEAIIAACTVMSQRDAAAAFGVSHGYVGNLVKSSKAPVGTAAMNGSGPHE